MIVTVILLAVFCEFIDAYLGMMYGTILSPVLIILGYDPKYVVPAILLSQAVGGAVASWRHNQLGNAVIFDKKSTNFKIGLLIIALGIAATVAGAYVGNVLPKEILKAYIGMLCVVMGSVVVSKKVFKFSWIKIAGIGIISAFNKAMSGGGYGPVVSTGQIIAGRDGKSSIVTTDFAEVPICLAGLASWFVIGGWPQTELMYLLPIGAVIGAYFGPVALSKFQSREKLTTLVGMLALILGLISLFFTGIKL